MDNQQTAPSQAPQKSNTRAVLIVIAAIIVLLAVAIIYRMIHKSANIGYVQKQLPPITSAQPTTAPSPTPTTVALQNNNTSNTQLDQDTQDIQNNLDKLNTDVSNVDQGFNNASNDVPQ